MNVESRRSGVTELLSSMREREAEREERMQRAEAIAAVADAIFDDHPEVKRQRERVALMERRLELTQSQSLNRRITESIAAMRAELAQRSGEIVGAAVDDLEDDPLTFRRAFAVQEEVRRLSCGIAAAEAVLSSLKGAGLSTPHEDNLGGARRELHLLLQGLRREHLGFKDE